MKVVLDTNVLIAAFVARGTCAEVLEQVIADHHLILSAFVLNEFERTMRRKFKFSAVTVDETIHLLQTVGQQLEPAPLPHPVCRDTDDDAVLALAVSAAAACLVTGDNDLLVLEHIAGIPIIKPIAFWSIEL